MTFLIFLGASIIGVLAITAWFFRKGGIYNKEYNDDMEIKDFTHLDYLESTPEPPVISTPTETTPTVNSKATVENCCLLIKEYEGWIYPGGKDWSGKVYPRGSRSYQNNSPGNVKFYSGGYLPKYLPVLKDGDGFAVFKDYNTGWMYLMNMVKVKIHLHPDRTFLQFFQEYAPTSDGNDPVAYTNYVVRGLGVDKSAKVSVLV
jgi:hypothetical protein